MRVLAAIDMRGSSAEHVTASCVRGSDHVSGILDSLKGRLDLQNIALLGHSYGGATVAGTLSLTLCTDFPELADRAVLDWTALTCLLNHCSVPDQYAPCCNT